MSTPPPPKLSDDGKFYWDGSRWVPMPPSGPKEILITGQPQRSGLETCVGIIGMAFVLLLLLIIAGLWCGHGTATP